MRSPLDDRAETRPESLPGAFTARMARAAELRRRGELRAAFAQLEEAHVLGQRRLGWHLGVHAAMLRTGWALGDAREVAGQILRLLLTPLGHFTGRLPLGNTGGAGVSAFSPMPVAPHLAAILARAEDESSEHQKF